MRLLLRYGTWILGLGLIALGVGALLLPGPSSEAYGVPTSEVTWVAATGCRDLALGITVLLLVQRQPDALRWVLPPAFLLPAVDAVLVVMAGRPWLNTFPHVTGAIVIGVLAVLAWRHKPLLGK